MEGAGNEHKMADSLANLIQNMDQLKDIAIKSLDKAGG